MRSILTNFLITTWTLMLNSLAIASESISLHDLEISVWTSDDSKLSQIEHDVVRAVQVDVTSAWTHLLMSHVLVRNFAKDPSDLYTLKQATDLAQQAVDLDPKKDYGYVAMAEILDLMGNSERGLKVLDDAEKSGIEKSWRFYFMKAKLSADHVDSKKVLEIYRQSLKLSETQPKVIIPYVIAVLQSEFNGESLIKEFGLWHRDFPSQLFEHSAAIAHAELGQHKKAHEIYNEILKNNPNSKEAKVNDAIILYRELNDPKRAASILESVLIQHRDDLSENMIAMIRAHLAACYAADKQWNKAEREFLLALAADHRNLSIIEFMSKSYRNAKAHSQLIKVLKQLNNSMPGTGLAHAILGETLSEHLARHDEAIRAYTDAIVLEPGRSDFYNGMGLAYYRKKNFEKALQSFTSASAVDPTDATARYNHACVLSLLGRTDEAITTLSEALALDPGLMKTAQGDSDFANIRGYLKFRELVSAPTAMDLPIRRTGH